MHHRMRTWIFLSRRPTAVFIVAAVAISNTEEVIGFIVSEENEGAGAVQVSESETSATMLLRIQNLRRVVPGLIHDSADFEEAANVVRQMIEVLRQMEAHTSTENRHSHQTAASESVDGAIADITDKAFAHRGTAGKRKGHNGRASTALRVLVGLDVVRLQQARSSGLVAPYDKTSPRILRAAIRALASMSERDLTDLRRRKLRYNTRTSSALVRQSPADEAYSILQRLVTGNGVRSHSYVELDERDFSLVLNAFAKAGRMDMAHRVMALQDRTPTAPPLSPVAYSIMVKAYGRLRQLENVDMTLQLASENAVQPDIVMLNSLVDAYINCDRVDRARAVFRSMYSGGLSWTTTMRQSSNATSEANRPVPNIRTYNTILKGYAKEGALHEAMLLSKEMRAANLWNDVTTNSMVNVAVMAKDFSAAEEILKEHTSLPSSQAALPKGQLDRRVKEHPNVEAYTELLDGYAKSGNLSKAMATLRIMRERGVHPNVVTYCCAISALSRQRRWEQARKMLDFLKDSGDIAPSTEIYNAYLTGLLSSDEDAATRKNEKQPAENLNPRVMEAVDIVQEMLALEVRPDEITAIVIFDGFLHCDPPRVDEALKFINRLVRDGFVKIGDARIGTALIRARSYEGDIASCIEAFDAIRIADNVALNALLDACCRNGQQKVAFDLFQKHSRQLGGTRDKRRKRRILPDVVTFSILISSLLKSQTDFCTRQAHQLYFDMTSGWKIAPDTGLVDSILEALLRQRRSGLRTNVDVTFALAVMKDANSLDFDAAKLRQRRRAVELITGGAVDSIDGADDPLFLKKGWNRVDSGFRLWGRGFEEAKNNKVLDPFLESKGWNDVDSSFRLF